METIASDHAVKHYTAGQQNYPSPYPTTASIDSMSHNWRGPGFYSVPDKKFVPLEETLSGPLALERSASASSACRSAGTLPRIPAADPWLRAWRGPGAGFYSPLLHTWTREMPGQTIASDSRLFMNEEDWLKYKFMCLNPAMGAGSQGHGADGSGEGGGQKNGRKSREVNILTTYF